MNRWGSLMVLMSVTLLGFISPMYADDWTIEELFAPRVYWSSTGFLALDHQNIPHLAIASSNDYWAATDGELRIASRTGEEWTFETVSNTESYFALASLAFDSQDRPAIVCWASDQIRYYFQAGGVWQFEVIRNESICSDFNFSFDGQDRPHLVFLTATELVHAVRLNGIWTFQAIESGSQISVPQAVMGTDDVFRVVYSVDGALQYATIDGTGSSITTESTGFTMIYSVPAITLNDQNKPHIAFVSDGMITYAYRDIGIDWYSETLGMVFAESLSILMEQSTVHVFSVELGTEGLNHYVRTGGGWQQERIYTDLIPHDVMVRTSQPGEVQIAILASSYQINDHLGELVYGVGNWNSWGSESVECVFKPGANPSLALDSSGGVHIAHGYHDVDYYSGFYSGYMTNQSGQWVSAITQRSETYESRVVVMPDGQPMIAISDGNQLQVGVHDGNRWSFETIANADYIGGIDMKVNSAGQIGISYYHESAGAGSVRYAFSHNGFWPIQIVESAKMIVGEARTVLAINSNDGAWISYYTRNDGREKSMRFAQRVSLATWDVITLDVPDNYYTVYDMELDPQGDYICFAHPYGEGIRIRTQTGTSWMEETLSVDQYTYRVKLEYDMEQTPHIVALSEAEGVPDMHFWKENGIWNADLLPFEMDANGFDVVINGQNQLHAVWVDESANRGLHHAFKDLDSSATPTPQPIHTGVTLEMPSHRFSPGDSCFLRAELKNEHDMPLMAHLFIILQIGSEYWFSPTWTHDVGYETIQVMVGRTQRMIIPPFVWPDTGSASMDGLRFWGGMMNESMTELLGGYQGISEWAFGFGP